MGADLRISEARCPRCLTYDGYVIELGYDSYGKTFTCKRDPSHTFVLDDNGFLTSRH